jgi:dihydroorotate dehydrogenase (fumarate)
MDLSTTYMGLSLKNPLVASASPLSKDPAKVKRLEDAGASAVVMYSLFEEQIRHEAAELDHYLEHGSESFAEALSYFPDMSDHDLGPEEYLNHMRSAKESLEIPVIGSLNGVTTGGWVSYAKKIEEAGADGLELNIYMIPTNPDRTGQEIEQRYVDVLGAVAKGVSIPVSVKIGPFFSSIPNMAARLETAGAGALVLFNRFYQPDLDLEELEVVPNLTLSSMEEARLPLRWIAILYGRIGVDMAATTGIHDSRGVIKMLMAGATVTQLCSTLLLNGVSKISTILGGVKEFMARKEYESVDQMRGVLSQRSCEEPGAFERANYMKALQSFRQSSV